MSLEQARYKALRLLEAIHSNQHKFDILNKAARDLYGDFYPHQTPIAEVVNPQVMELLDELTEGMASYLLYEVATMEEGGGVSVEGRSCKIKNVDDIRIYLNDRKDEI